MKIKPLLLCTMLTFLGNTLFAQALTVDHFVKTWDNMTQMVVETAKKMPEEYYDFKPNQEIRSFADQMNHITRSNIGLGSMVFGKKSKMKFKKNKPPKDKKAIIEVMEQSFAFFREQLEDFSQADLATKIKWGHPKNPLEVSKLQGLLMIYSHLQLEYGKTTIYARSKGIAPAPSAGWRF